jgi:S-methylmethionine-dependent homocysteine/selenocysteine methylase
MAPGFSLANCRIPAWVIAPYNPTMHPVLLDGAMGTELMRRGVDTSLPLWSARALVSAPDVVREIHADYVRAGADILTTNTFRTHRRTLARGGLGDRTAELTRLAVELARSAAPRGGSVRVAGSIAPLEDCYAPELVPAPRKLEKEHAEIAELLAAAGCDLLLVETMNTIREAVAAARAATATGLPVMVSLVVGPGGLAPGAPGDRAADIVLLGGETIAAAVRALEPLSPAALLVNCVPLADSHRALALLAAAASVPIGIYANVGRADRDQGWTLTDDVLPDAYAQAACEWIARGAAIVGGCCGTTPAHVQAMAAAMRRVRGAP